MKTLFLILSSLVVVQSGAGQGDADSLLAALDNVAHDDSLFESFARSHRRTVYSQPRLAYELYRKVESVATGKGLSAVAALALDVQGVYFQNAGAFDSAEICYRQSLRLRSMLDDEKLLTQSYNNLGVLHRRKGQYDSALFYYHKSLGIAEAQQDSVLMGDYLSNIGLVHQNQQDFENAIRYNLRSLAIRLALRDTLKIAASYNNLGIVYTDLKDYNEAGNYLEQSLAMKRRIGERGPVANTLINLGTVYYHLEDFSKASSHLLEALSIYRQLNASQNTAATLENLAFVAMKAGDLPSAYEYSREALMLRKALGHPGDIISSYTNTARVLIDLQQTKVAASLLDTAYQLARDFGEVGSLKKVAQEKAHLYETLGDYARAYRFQLEYSALKDSLLNENTLSRIAELREQYEAAEKEQALQIQEAKLLQQEALITQRLQQRNFMMVFAGAVFVISLLIFFSYRARLRAREALNRKTLEMEEVRSRFFANISHEFRTPLTLIHSVADELTATDVDATLVKTVKTNANRLLQLVDQLLDLARVDAGRLGIAVRPGDISGFIRAVGASFASLSAQKGIAYSMKVEDPIYGYFDADKLEKILVNLLSNAFKFTPEKGAVDLIARSRGDNLSLVVADTGPGIPEGEKARIFERFYQVPGNDHYGTGIGLSLTRELIEILGGAIVVESAEGNGTRFQVTLPLSLEAYRKRRAVVHHDQGQEVYSPTVPDPEEKNGFPDVIIPGGDKRSVLIVEDNADLRRYVKQIMSANYHVLEACNGEEGLRVAEKVVPDIIISDIMMPVMDGVALCEKLKASVITSHIPVILLTAKASEEDKLTGLHTGADDYLVKPFSKKELLVRIHNLIRQREKLIAKFSRSLNPREIKLNSSDEIFMTRLRDILEANLDDSSFSVNQLSREIGMSRTQLFRKIQALTGFSASEFMRVVRLNRAAEMLKNKTGSVSEVAYRVGFNNLSYFARCFKARFGTTPGNYA